MYALYIPSLKDKSHALEKQSRVSAVFKDRSNPAAARRSPKQMIVQLNAWVLKKFQVASNFTIYSLVSNKAFKLGDLYGFIGSIIHLMFQRESRARFTTGWLVQPL